jgi:hypothetical protein
MTDDRSLERAARSWLDEGPTRAPDRPVDAALSRIQTIRQERDLRVPWRMPTMNPMIRLAGAAVLVLAVSGAVLFAMRPAANVGPPATPTAPASTAPQASAGDLLADYRSARNAVCLRAAQAVSEADLGGLYDTSLSAADRARVNAEHVKYTQAVKAAATELAAIQPPEAIASEHWKDVAREEAVAALHELFDERAATGDIAGGAALDEAITRAAEGRAAFEGANRLFACP